MMAQHSARSLYLKAHVNMNHVNPIVLAVDTSCDDTAVAVTQGLTVLSNVVASQTQLHKPYGGVFPTVAKQAHKENIAPTARCALKRAGVLESEIDIVAVTQGPGLAPALEVGIAWALSFAERHAIPVVPIHHIEGHILSVLAKPRPRSRKQLKKNKTRRACAYQLPALAIIVSGGHTQFVLVEEIGSYKVIGTTVDDAAGECLDKVGRMLNLGYPAGPTIEQLAKAGNASAVSFPLPMTTTKTYDMSFSGLKTFARNTLTEMTSSELLSQQEVIDFCASIQYAVFRHISYKLEKFLSSLEGTFVRDIWLGGGVAANTQLRRTIRKVGRNHTLKVQVPYAKRLCGDNAAMIGVVAGANMALDASWVEKTQHDGFERKPRLQLATAT